MFDASQFDMFRLCEARFNYRYNMNLIVADGTSVEALDKGTLVHLGNEVYYQSLKEGLKYDEAVQMALMKIKSTAAINDYDEEIVKRVLDVLEEYYDYWRFEDQKFEIVDVEQSFLYTLFENDVVRILMSGKIDLIVSDNKYKNLPYDHKTFSRSGEVGRMSNQFKNYVNALNSTYLVVNRIGFQKSLKPHEKFLRVMLAYDPILINEWKDNVVKVMMHYLDCITDKSWPMNETSCDKFNRRCEYYDVCDSSGQQAKMFKLQNQYKQIEPWDVTKVLAKTSEQLEAKAEEIQLIKDNPELNLKSISDAEYIEKRGVPRFSPMEGSDFKIEKKE